MASQNFVTRPGSQFVQSGTGAVERTVAEKLQDVVSVKDFGAVGDGVTDDGPAFNAAIAASKSVSVPEGTYLIKTQIVIDSGVQLFGETGVIPRGNTTGGAQLKYHSDLGTNPMVLCRQTSWFTDLAFDGPAKGTGTALRNRKVVGNVAYEDTDVTVSNCTFYGWDVAVDHYNRGLLAEENSFALVTTGIKITADATNWIDDPGNQYDGINEGFRAIAIRGNRFHAATTAIDNTGTDAEKLRGLVVANNLIDIGDILFKGGCRYSSFSGNIADQASFAPLVFTTNVDYLTIVGNVLKGDSVQVSYPFELMTFDGTAKFCTITGNTLENAGGAGIRHTGAVDYCTYTANTFKDIGEPGNTTRGCIRFFGNVTNSSITGNTFQPKEQARCIRGTSSATWTGVYITGNAFDPSYVLYQTFIDGGSNWFQPQGSVFSIPTGKLDLGSNNLGATQVEIDDDSVASITTPRKGGFALITANGDSVFSSNTNSTFIYYDVGSSLRITKMSTAEGANVDTVTTPLTGTTGTDGKTTVSVQADILQIENRAGASITYQVTFL